MLPNLKNLYKTNCPKWTIPFFLAASFLVWFFLFHKVILQNNYYSVDAVAYHDHYLRFISNIIKGVYPLWDPLMDLGNLNEFALRRIGEFNPLYSLLVVFYLLIKPFTIAYHVFLAVYFFIGALGFYALVKRITRSSLIAFTAFLLLFFSTLGMRIFYDFIIIVFTPLMWFFYFFISFLKKPSKHDFLGSVIFTSVLFSTYVPFYFVVIFLLFCVIGTICFFPSILRHAPNTIRFFFRNWLLTILGFLIVFSSLIPGYLFYKSGKSNEFIMTQRTSSITDRQKPDLSEAAGNSLKVKSYTLGEQGVIIPLVSADLLSDPRKISLSQFFMPFFGLLLLCLGIITPLSRRLIFTGVWFFVILIICQNDGTPIGPFLYKNVALFRYFRNVYLFLWIALAPLLIFFASELFGRLIMIFKHGHKNTLLIKLTTYLIHIGFILLLLVLRHKAFTSYAAILLSLTFFELIFRKIIKTNSLAVYSFLFLIVVIQPLQGYSKSARIYKIPDYVSIKGQSAPAKLSFQFTHKFDLYNPYLLNPWLGMFLKTSKHALMTNYLEHKIMLFDAVTPMDEDKKSFDDIVLTLAHEPKIAFVTKEYTGPLTNGTLSPQLIRIKENNPLIAVKKYTFNDLVLKTDLPKEKFLVYNESYHPDWRVYINGKPAELIRANIAFKGVWVPAGKSIVKFKFGKPFRHFIGWWLLISIYSASILMIYLIVKKERSECANK